jgi:hypothetical protein
MSRFRGQCRTTDKFSIRRLENINAQDVEPHTGKLAGRRRSRLVRNVRNSFG